MGDSPPEAAAEVFGSTAPKSMLPHAKELVFNPEAGRLFFGCLRLVFVSWMIRGSLDLATASSIGSY